MLKPAKSLLGADEDIGDILVLTEQGDVEKNLEGLAVSRQHNKLSLATVQGLSRLVGTLKIAMKLTFGFLYSSSKVPCGAACSWQPAAPG